MEQPFEALSAAELRTLVRILAKLAPRPRTSRLA